jgi:predicted house-cleaning noncanonical NTP pyrophosphatase (MazG superfamily)
MQKEYNKAIRDKIPEIMRKTGKICNVKKMDNQEFLAALEDKLMEEMNEYYESRSPEELADLMEVIYRIAELKGVSQKQLEQIRIQKNNDRGDFSENLFLISGEV